MIHCILQFALRIAFRCVLHRCESQDIHRQELCFGCGFSLVARKRSEAGVASPGSKDPEVHASRNREAPAGESASRPASQRGDRITPRLCRSGAEAPPLNNTQMCGWKDR